jgi:hypothetical protein
MNARDRNISLGLLAGAVPAWVLVGLLFTTRSPEGDLGVQLAGAVLLGLAFAVTATPLAWLAVFGRHGRIAYRGDWTRALRRGVTVGLVVALFVVLRSQSAFSLPLALFIVVMALFIELRLSAR